MMTGHRGILGSPYFIFESCTSTNLLLEGIAQQAFAEGVVVRSATQSCGRGRQGSEWFSHPRSAQFSFLLRPRLAAEHWPLINIITSYAILKTLYQQTGIPLWLKWPNDVMSSGRKIAGVMSTTRTGQQISSFVIVGCGVNLNLNRDDFPDSLRSIATSVQIESGRELDIDIFIDHFFRHFTPLYQRFQDRSN